MRRSVYLRSTLRQPVKTIFLLLLVGVISFTFLVRGLECALVYRETDRLGSYYRSIATLEKLQGTADYEAVAEYLEANPDVKCVNRIRPTSGILPEGQYNADLDGMTFSANWQSLDMRISPNSVLFYGFYKSAWQVGSSTSSAIQYSLDFQVDKVLSSYPEYIFEGKRVTLTGSAGTAELHETLEPGKRYLVRALYHPARISDRNSSLSKFYLAPVRQTGSVWAVEAETDVDLSAPEYSELSETLRLAEENRRGLYILGVADASARPNAQEVSHTDYLVEGRWPNAEDTAQERRVCAIHKGFADTRKLKIGDTLDVELLNIRSLAGYTGFADAVENHDTAARQSESYQIVGIYGHHDLNGISSTNDYNYVYVPLTTIPNDFVRVNATYNTASSFELFSPDGEEEFLMNHQDKLQELGFRAVFLKNGWDNFNTAAAPMRRSALYNAVLFGVILLMALCLAVFAYFRFRRKEAVICRALGDSAAKCVWGISAPMLLLGLVGIGTGGVLAWRYVSGHMETLLSGLEGYEPGAATLPLWTVFAFCGGVLLLLTVVTLLFAIFLMKRPVLALLQGGGPQAKAPKTAPAAPMPAFSGGGHGPAVEFAPSLAAPTPGARGWGYTLRFVRRHIFRAPLKSLLALLLAGVFLVGLAAIQVTLRRDKAELERLYQTIEVDVEITKANPSYSVEGEGYIDKKPVDAILESGYVKNNYLEGGVMVNLSTPTKDSPDGELLTEKLQVFGAKDTEIFFRERGAFPIDSYGEPLINEGSHAIILPRTLLEALELEPGQRITVTNRNRSRIMAGVTIAGVHDGANQNVALTSLPFLEELAGNLDPYCKARFTLDPTRNRELNGFLALVDEAISAPLAGTTELSKIVWDQELRQVVKPLEQSIAFMEILYPITVALSLLVSAGAALLLVILSSRESAILRVLGTEKRRVMATLCLQTVIPCVIGLLIGFAVIGTALGSTKELLLPTLAQAGGYLLAAVLAAAVTATALSKRNPLAALQAKD